MIRGPADLLERNGDRSGRMGISIEPEWRVSTRTAFAILHETVGGIRWRDAADRLQGLAGVTAGSFKGSLVLRVFAVRVAVVLACRFWLLYEDRRRIARWKGQHRSLVDQKVETYPLFLR